MSDTGFSAQALEVLQLLSDEVILDEVRHTNTYCLEEARLIWRVELFDSDHVYCSRQTQHQGEHVAVLDKKHVIHRWHT